MSNMLRKSTQAEIKTVLEFVSRGAGWFGLEPYPDATARKALAAFNDWQAYKLPSVRPSFREDQIDPLVVDILTGRVSAGFPLRAHPAEIHAAVVILTNQGMSKSQISGRLGIAPRQVTRHRAMERARDDD